MDSEAEAWDKLILFAVANISETHHLARILYLFIQIGKVASQEVDILLVCLT